METLARAIRRVLSVPWFLSLILLTGLPVMACNCTGGHSPCGEVVLGSAAFTGRAISVSPAFLNRFNRSNRSDAGRVAQFYDQLGSGVAAQNLQELKERFRAFVPDLPADLSQRLDQVDSPQQLLKLFDTVLNHGSNVTFEVKTVFTAAGRDDDDDKNAKAKDDDDDDRGNLAAGKLFSVWTPFGDCGIEFQTGETYLVYASMDEDTDSVETDICMGTRRLSDAGADLPYLSFYKIDPKESGHLDGFVTSDPAVQANPTQSDTIPLPVAGILIELKSDEAARYATSGRDGRFVFDGLAEDSYQLSGFASDYPDPGRIVAGPVELKIKAKTCARRVLLVRPD